ncbi:MAG: isoprenyl transferase [Candidatus Sumerlaeota bacterium]|nr:isoprenyl transferase [Candidatus Sumerlaeota bacterium]
MPPADTTREQALLAQLDRDRLPRHVAIIMDGNGRWARLHGYTDRTEGHRAAIQAVRAATETAHELGLRVLTLYAFSTENWTRPRKEVSFLMRLFQSMLTRERRLLMDNNVRLVHSGRFEDLPRYAQRALRTALDESAANTGMILNLALSYGGRAEIAEAARAFARDVADGRRRPEELDIGLFARYLYHPELGDPDLLIRTSGERRISNFLLWQIAYSEIFVTPTLWPDFGRADLLEALLDYQRRERRFGGILSS